MGSDLLKLADACEAATGPDRELDREIAPLIGLRIVNEGHPIGRVCYDENSHGVPLPAFTASIDAAMTLLAPGTLWAVGSMEDGPFARLCWPQPDGGFTGGYFEAEAATAPLALCAAALRARTQATGDE